jgi:A/G-specific adenine glycosylase
MRISIQKILGFQTKIFLWWEKNRRDLLWRRTHDPYQIFISEVMLQQTQVTRVLPIYLKFISKFPTVNALSHAPISDVLKAWKGMGYNRRALYLKKAAGEIVKKYDGIFPDDEKILLTLPGVGKYTARAILVFAYRKDISLIDTNIRQIITHFFFDDGKQKEKDIEEIATQLVPVGKSWEWHQALMDYGALALRGDVKPSKKTKKHEKVPFRESDRFFRGRIIDALREKSYSELELIEFMIENHGKNGEFFNRILTGLEKDDLIKRKQGRISLP